MQKQHVLLAALGGMLWTSALWAQIPTDFTPLAYEAEDYSTPQSAWKLNQTGDDHWNLWSTDADAAKKWSGGVVLQSPMIKQDRATPEEGAPPLHTHITGIPKGRYVVELGMARTLAISRDGTTWEKKAGGDNLVGVVDIADGTFDLWVDDRYANEGNPGTAYYDYLRFTPTLPRVDKPKVEGFARTRVREAIDRGLVATPGEKGGVYLGWRLLDPDPAGVGFNVYRSVAGQPAEKLNAEPLTATTDFLDKTAPAGGECQYTVRAVVDGTEQAASKPASVSGSADAPGCVVYKLDPGETVQKVGVGDLDGDGRYDYVLKTPQDNIDPWSKVWTPSPDTYKLDAISADGRRLWRKDLGWAIERGIWYSPMIVHDLDGDGRAEVALKAGEGDPRGADGRVETGPEWLSILDGATGEELARDAWLSRETPGEKYNYNLASRNQMCIAYLDGKTPGLVVNRGTYTTIRLAAYQFHDKKLEQLWTWDSREELGRGRYNSQGAHIMHAADIDGDSRDEVVFGSAVVDDNGNGLWTTGFGHPDFCFVGDIDPLHPGLEIFYGIEPARKDSGLCLVEAQTGKVLWGLQEPTTHVGTDGMCADIDASHPGSECYAADIGSERTFTKGWLFSAQGELIADKRDGAMSLPVHWDADPQRELVRGDKIVDFGGQAHATKLAGHVVAIADVLGDWREELITSVPGELRIYTTTIPAADRRVSLMQDPIYRTDVAIAFMGYYAPPMLSYDLASQAQAAKSSAPAKVALWPGKAPVGDGAFETVASEVKVYLPPPDKATGAAVVICPGGGYIRHVVDREGYPIAEWLNANGIAAILLEYRLPEGRPYVPLLDAQRAIRLARANAAEWKIDPQRVGILGFSAGGHVASTAGTHFDAGRADDADPIEHLSCRPDFMLLVYPVVTMGEKTHELSRTKLLGANPTPDLVRLFSNETQVTDETPPAFLVHAQDDVSVPPDNSRNFVAAMQAHHVPVEYLELPSGGHGLNGCKGPLWEEWKAKSLAWLASRGFTPKAQ